MKHLEVIQIHKSKGSTMSVVIIPFFQCLNLNLTTIFKSINPFHANVPFLYPLKTSENKMFSDVFRGCRNGALVWKGLINFITVASLYTPWKHQKSYTFSDVFKRVGKRPMVTLGVPLHKTKPLTMINDQCIKNIFFLPRIISLSRNYSKDTS